MAETDWKGDWNWDEKSDDFMRGYCLGKDNSIFFVLGYMVDVVNDELIYYFEDDE